MENKKNNTGLIIALIVFIILSIVLGGYIVYNQLANKETINNDKSDAETEKKDNNTTNTENIEDSDTNKEEQTPISIVDFYFNSVAIVSKGEVYVNVYGSTSEIDDLYGEGTFQSLMATRNNYQEYTFNNFEYLLDDNTTFNGMKLNTNNVAKVYSYAYGQTLSSNYGLILLNQDKTLSIISLYSLIQGKTDVKPISELSNIESIITENNGGMFTYAVNQNGEKINLNDYIPNDYHQF